MKRRARKANVQQQPVKKKRKTQHNTQSKTRSKKTRGKKSSIASAEEELQWLKEQIEKEEEECNHWEKLMHEENRKYLESKDEALQVKDEKPNHPVFKECEKLEKIKKKTEQMLKRMEERITKLTQEHGKRAELLRKNNDLKLQKQQALDWIAKGGSDTESESELEDEEEAFHEVLTDPSPQPSPQPSPKPSPKQIKTTRIKRRPEKPKKKKRRVSFGSGPNPEVKIYHYEAVEFEQSHHENVRMKDDEEEDTDDDIMYYTGVGDDSDEDEEPNVDVNIREDVIPHGGREQSAPPVFVQDLSTLFPVAPRVQPMELDEKKAEEVQPPPPRVSPELGEEKATEAERVIEPKPEQTQTANEPTKSTKIPPKKELKEQSPPKPLQKEEGVEPVVDLLKQDDERAVEPPKQIIADITKEPERVVQLIEKPIQKVDPVVELPKEANPQEKKKPDTAMQIETPVQSGIKDEPVKYLSDDEEPDTKKKEAESTSCKSKIKDEPVKYRSDDEEFELPLKKPLEPTKEETVVKLKEEPVKPLSQEPEPGKIADPEAIEPEKAPDSRKKVVPPPKEASKASEPQKQEIRDAEKAKPVETPKEKPVAKLIREEKPPEKAEVPPKPKELKTRLKKPKRISGSLSSPTDTAKSVSIEDMQIKSTSEPEEVPDTKPVEQSVESVEMVIEESDSENEFMASTPESAASSDNDGLADATANESDTFLPPSNQDDDTPQSPAEAEATIEANRTGDEEIDLGFGMDEDDDELDIPPISPTSTSPKSNMILDGDEEEETILEPITVDLSPVMEPMEDDAGMQIEAVTLEPIEFEIDDEYGNFENEALSPIMTSLAGDDSAIPAPPKLDLDQDLEYACIQNASYSRANLKAKNVFQSLPMRLLSLDESQVDDEFLRPAMFCLQYRKFNPYQWYAMYTKTLQFIDEITFPQARTFIAALSVVSKAIAECVKELKTRFDRQLPNHIYKKSLLFNLQHVITLSLSTGYVMKPTIDGELLDFMKGDKLEKKHKINFTRFLCAWIQVMEEYDAFEELLRIILTRFNITTRVMLLTEIKNCLPEMAKIGFFEHHAELIGTILGYWEHLQSEDAMQIRKLTSDLCCNLGHTKIIDREFVIQMVENQLIQINNAASQLNNLKWMESDALLRSLNQLTYDVELICLSCHGWVSHHAFLAVCSHLKGINKPKPQFFFLRLIAFIYRGILDRQHFAEIQNPHTSVEINFYREYPNAFLKIGKATQNKELASCLYCCLFVMREKNLAYELKEFKDLDERKIMKYIRFFPQHEAKIRGSLGFGKLDDM